MGPGELLASRAQLPTLLPGRPVQRVDPALQIREEDGVFVDQRRAEDAPIRRQLEAHGLDHLVLPPRLGLSRPPPELRIAVGPADLAVGRQLVERRGGRGRAEVDVAGHDDGRGVDGPDLLARALGGEPPLLFEPAGIVPADRLLALVVAATEDVVVVRRPILRVGLRASRGRLEDGRNDEGQRRTKQETCHGGLRLRPVGRESSRRIWDQTHISWASQEPGNY